MNLNCTIGKLTNMFIMLHICLCVVCMTFDFKYLQFWLEKKEENHRDKDMVMCYVIQQGNLLA
jgi:hypothetical protein